MRSFVLSLFAIVILTASARAADHCSIGLAKKFADAVIPVEVKENRYPAGKLTFRRADSFEYTLAYIDERLRDGSTASGLREMKLAIEANPAVHFYRMNYTWDAGGGYRLSFSYILKLKNYDRGCTLEQLTS